MPDICFMKTSLFRLSSVPLLVLGFSLSFTQCTDLAGLDDNPDAEEQLLAMESSGILFMREEEKLARDVYLYLYEIYPLRPFLNISKSEQAHMDAMLYLIDTLNLVDPVGDNPPGVFQNEELQELYDELIEQGSESQKEALRVGALIEEVDIIDIQRELDENASHEEVIRVYTNLIRASGNHLRAFVGVLGLYDVEYEPILLDPDQFTQIIEN
jgi:hypothetical protein